MAFCARHGVSEGLVDGWSTPSRHVLGGWSRGGSALGRCRRVGIGEGGWVGGPHHVFPRAGLQAWVKQRVHEYCAAAPLATTGAWRLLLKNRSHADLVWAVLSMLSFLGDVAAHGGRMAFTRDGIGGSPVRSGVRSPTARTTPCPISMRLTRMGRPQACVASAQSTPGIVVRPCRLSPPRARAVHAWTARRSTRRGRQPSHTSRGTPCRGVHGPRTLVESDRVCDTARNEAHAS
jgi:hypothetical protein